DSLTSFRD
uniref:Uncharacterized protein n=1 Tax=Globodera pallida TaxID=36090 RepID=A0A183C1I4_GLOPA